MIHILGVTSSVKDLAAFVIATTAILGGLISIYRLARRIDSAIGTDHDGRTLADRMSRVEHQLWRNGGDSLADKVHDLESLATETRGEMTVIREMLGLLINPGATRRN